MFASDLFVPPPPIPLRPDHNGGMGTCTNEAMIVVLKQFHLVAIVEF
jgi:hypothetical protein